MRINTGIDMVEISRIAASMKNPRFLSRCFSPSELSLLEERGMRPEIAAANFCAKEAFSKAIGTGIRGFKLTDISVLRDPMGKPYLSLTGGAAEIAGKRNLCFDVSLSHSRDNAIAIVLAYTKADRSGPESGE